MSSSWFVFPGHPSYVATAAEQLDRPAAAPGAGRLVALTALANLCAQASRAEPAQVDAILSKAIEFRDQLAVAHRAATAMLADVEAVFAPPRRDPDPIPATEDAAAASPAGRAVARPPARGRAS